MTQTTPRTARDAVNDGELSDDGPVCSETRIVRARRDHQCVECGGAIRRWVCHEVVSGLWPDSGWARYRTCLPCQRIRDHYCPSGYLIGEVREIISECLGLDYLSDGSDWDDDEEAS